MDVFDYSRNIILYDGVEYPFCSIWFDAYNQEVIFSTIALSDKLFINSRWKDALAEYIDNKIIFFVSEDEIKRSKKYLLKILKSNIL